MKKKFLSDKKNILILIFALVAIIILIIYFFGNKKEEKFSIVTSSSKFYTVSNCVSRYINYLYTEDNENILLLLDSSYKNKHNITNNNLFEKLGKLDYPYSFEAKKMYQEFINKNTIKYYISGYLIKEDMDGNDYSEKEPYYIIVCLNLKNSTYSITPYDGDIFVNGGK